MRYEEYNVEDFLFDEFFVRWIKNPGPETQHFWENWIEKNPQKLDTINKSREIILSVNYKNRYEPSGQEYNEVLENILRQSDSFRHFEEVKKNDSLAVLVKLAAVLIVICGVSAMFFHMSTQQGTDMPLEQSRLIERQNPNGQKATFGLQDGTIVRLNAGSQLIFPEEFTAGERKVYLKGEAFFEVKRDESRPFIVETRDLVTQVLGTSFNVNSYPEEDHSFVAVADGKVAVSKKSAGISSDQNRYTLGHHQMAVYDASQNSIIKKEHISDDLFAWKDNTILFDHNDFDFILARLTRWYGVEFIIQSGKEFKGRLTARYQNQPLDLVLEGLKDEYGFNYKMEEKGKKIFIY